VRDHCKTGRNCEKERTLQLWWVGWTERIEDYSRELGLQKYRQPDQEKKKLKTKRLKDQGKECGAAGGRL